MSRIQRLVRDVEGDQHKGSTLVAVIVPVEKKK